MRKSIIKNLVVSFALIFLFNINALAKTSLSISSSASSLNIGDTTTVTVALNSDASMASGKISVKYDASKLEFVSCSDTYGGGNGLITLSTDKASIVLKAKSAGSVSISASAEDVWEDETEVGVLSGGSTSVEIKNAASEKPVEKPAEQPDKKDDEKNDNNTKDDKKEDTKPVVLSADNSLKSLELSAGKLSPSFQYNKTKYTATVPYDTKSVNVAAQVSNSKASIVSLTGNDDLKVGENVISIVVKAENGVTAEYKVVVTREDKKQEVETPKDPEEDNKKEEPETPVDENEEEAEELMVKLYGVEYYIPTSMMNVEIPLSFYSSEVECSSEVITAYSSYRYDFDIAYMREIFSDEYLWYILGEKITPLVKIDGDNGKYIYVLEDTNEYDETYETLTVKISNFDVKVNKLKNGEDQNVILYGVDENGEFSRYIYNTENETYKKYDDTMDIVVEEEVKEEEEDKEDNYKIFFIICGILIAIGIIAIIVINIITNNIDDEEDEEECENKKYKEKENIKKETVHNNHNEYLEKRHNQSSRRKPQREEIEEYYDEDDYEEKDREYRKSLIDDSIHEDDSIEDLTKTAKINIINAQKHMEDIINPKKKK